MGERGGIPRVMELSARVALEGETSLSLLSVEEEGGPFTNSGLWAGCGGARFRFVGKCLVAALQGKRILYDQLGTARAHFHGLGRPYGVWIHGIEVWEDLRRDRLRAAQGAGAMIANSEYTRERSGRQNTIFQAAEVCWLGTQSDDAPETRLTLEGPPVVCIVGRLDELAYKGHNELITAWPKVLKAVPEARLKIVGSGPFLSRYRAAAASSEARSKIEVLGSLSDKALEDVWRETTVFAMPSRGEGFGLVYIEAMRWGVPVIASVHDAGREINLHGSTGFNIDLDRPTDLAQALICLLRDRDLALRLGNAGQRRWREHFSYSAFRERFRRQLTRLQGL